MNDFFGRWAGCVGVTIAENLNFFIFVYQPSLVVFFDPREFFKRYYFLAVKDLKKGDFVEYSQSYTSKPYLMTFNRSNV